MHAVVRTPAEADETFDYIVCVHKAIDQESVPDRLAPAVDESKTTIVIIQNGVGNEQPFRRRFPGTSIISCVVCNQIPLSALICAMSETEPFAD